MPKPSDVVEALRVLGFCASDEALRAMLEQLTKARASPVEACEKLAQLERRERDSRNLARRTHLAALGSFKTLDRFDWNHPKAIDRAEYDELRELAFIDKHENVLLRGPSGVGKTTLAQNLGLAALQAGYSVRFTTLAAALADLLKQESLPALERRLRRYLLPALLIVDEIGFVPCDSRSADLLYNIISRRHEQRATVITTNRLCGAPHNRFNVEPTVMRSLGCRDGTASSALRRSPTPHYRASGQGGYQLVGGSEAARS